MGQNSAGTRFLRHARITAQGSIRRLLGLALVGFAVAAPPEPTPFDARRAWGDLNRQVAFGPRPPETKAHLDCRDFLTQELKASTDAVTLQPFVHRWSQTGKPVKMWNVIGTQNWECATTRVLLMAHWDTRPTADMEYLEEDRRKPILGANDGASGVAVLLELARTFKAHPVPGLGIQYALVDGEDLGPGLDEMFLGAKVYARAMPEKKPNYGILLDMIGDKDLEVPKEPFSMRYAPKLVKAMWTHAAKVNLDKTFTNRVGPQIYDDHLSINEAGVPMVDLIDFSYPAWHTLGDDATQCSEESLGKVGRFLESWLRADPTFRDAKG